jgi:hypothetical protein
VKSRFSLQTRLLLQWKMVTIPRIAGPRAVRNPRRWPTGSFTSAGSTPYGVDSHREESLGRRRRRCTGTSSPKDQLIAEYLRQRFGPAGWPCSTTTLADTTGGTRSTAIQRVFELLGDWFEELRTEGVRSSMRAPSSESTTRLPVVTRSTRRQLTTRFVDLCDEAGVEVPSLLARPDSAAYDAALVSAHIDGPGRPRRRHGTRPLALLKQATARRR